MMACHVAVRPRSEQSTRWRQHHSCHMLLLPPRAAATARAGSADIVPHACVAGQATVDVALTYWQPSGAHAAHERRTMLAAAPTAHRSLVLARAAGRGRSLIVMLASVAGQELGPREPVDATWRAHL